MEQNSERLLHITIGTHPTEALNLEQEIRLAKAALLYADRVKLYSLTSSVLSMTSRFGELPLSHKIKILVNTIPLISPKNQSKKLMEIFKEYKKIENKRHLNQEDLVLKKQIEYTLNNSWNIIEQATNELMQNSRIQEMDKALNAGLLELHIFDNANTNDAIANFMIESIDKAVKASSGVKSKSKSEDNKLLMEFIEKIFKSISDGSTYPLFDEQTASLVSAGINVRRVVVPEFGLDRGKQLGIVKHLFEYLPTFEEATIDEILDIRKELENPLTRFRKAIISFSQDIKSATWDKDFQPEADKIYLRDVKPALLDIDESVKSNKFLTSLIKKFAEKPAVLPVGSLLSIAISQFSSLPSELAASFGIGAASASIIYEAYDEWTKKKQTTEQNLLYFYYGVKQRLKK